MKRVTGIGGVFFTTKDPKATRDWYQRHLGFNTDAWGTAFVWRKTDQPEALGFTQWSPFPADTDYFAPSPQPYMINYRVDNLEALVAELKKEGITIVDEIATYPYGKFVHILDLDGNKVELWEPVDESFDEAAEGKTF